MNMKIRGNSKKILYTCFGGYIIGGCVTKLENLAMEYLGNYRITIIIIGPHTWSLCSSKIMFPLVPSSTVWGSTNHHSHDFGYAQNTRKIYYILFLTVPNSFIINSSNMFHVLNLL